MVEFTIDGSEAVRKSVTEVGTGAHVFVPKEWRDEDVMIVRLAEPSLNDETERDRDAPTPPLTVEYDPVFDSATVTTTGEKETSVREVGGSAVYAGTWPRELFESAYNKESPETYIGYNENSQTGVRAVPVDRQAWFRHAAVFGTTGYGKTTFLKNLMVQWAYGGFGFCFIDSKGDEVNDLLRELPSHRLGDVLWVDPAGDDSVDRVVGFNFLQPGADRTDEQAFSNQVETIVDGLCDLVRNGTYWGARMDGLFSTVCRSMAEAETPYTLIDLYSVLSSEEYRDRFASEIDDEAVHEYLQAMTEEMKDEDIEPVLRRLKRLIESRAAREIMAHGEAGVTLEDAINDGRIILVNNSGHDSNERQLIANAIIQQIASAAQSRVTMPEGERMPFHMVIDDFDSIVNRSTNMEELLSKARSMRLSFTLCCQHPSQLPEESRKAIFGNCDTFMAMNPSTPRDADLIMDRFGEAEAADLLDLGRYEMYTRLSLGVKRSEPFVTSLFPSYPPLRGEDEAEVVKEQSLQRYGTSRLNIGDFSDATVHSHPAR